MFTSTDYDKFRALRVTHVAAHFEQLLTDEANDGLIPSSCSSPPSMTLWSSGGTTGSTISSAVHGSPSRTPPLPRSPSRKDGASPPCGERLRRPTTGRRPHDWTQTPRLDADPTTGRRPHDWTQTPRLDADPTTGRRPHEPAHRLAHWWREDLPRLRDRDPGVPHGHAVTCVRMDTLARKLVIARADGIAHQKLLNELSDVDLLIIDDFLTVGIDSDAAADLFAVLANREHRLPTRIAAQSGPGYWVEALPDRVAADSIVNRLANHARKINLGQVDMRELLDQRSHADTNYWE